MRGYPVQVEIINKHISSATEEALLSTSLSFIGMCSITKGGEGFRSAETRHSVDINAEYLELTMPLLPNYMLPHEWEMLEDKTGHFTMRQEDIIKVNGKEFDIYEVANNTLRPKGKHFVVLGVG